jgi:hypothetical protein
MADGTIRVQPSTPLAVPSPRRDIVCVVPSLEKEVWHTLGRILGTHSPLPLDLPPSLSLPIP